jgi:hypothetical protein
MRLEEKRSVSYIRVISKDGADEMLFHSNGMSKQNRLQKKWNPMVPFFVLDFFSFRSDFNSVY